MAGRLEEREVRLELRRSVRQKCDLKDLSKGPREGGPASNNC